MDGRMRMTTPMMWADFMPGWAEETTDLPGWSMLNCAVRAVKVCEPTAVEEGRGDSGGNEDELIREALRREGRGGPRHAHIDRD